MTALHKLTAAQIQSAVPGKYSDGGGLWFHKRGDGGAQWFLRVTIHGRRREMGLGPFPQVTLKSARAKAAASRALVLEGVDPIKERERLRREAARNIHLLNDIVNDAFESRKAELKGDGIAGRWMSPLQLHVLPKLGKIPVSDIDQRDIRDTLAPIWHTKADTARKAMNRLGICLKHAAALGLNVDLQAVDKAKALLGKTRHRPKNVPAMSWTDVPSFYDGLDEGTITHLALRLLILTAVRSKPLRSMTLKQVQGNIWVIPGEAMKGRRGATDDFRVPLSNEALLVISEASKFEREGNLFPSLRKGVLSDATMSRFMERAGLSERPHGFRSSFRTWCAEATETPRDVAETCLGHVIGSNVERAYRRTDLLEKRREVMEAWAKHCVGPSRAPPSINLMQK